MGATQALSAMNPSLVSYLGANPYSVAGKTMLTLGNDMEDSGYKKAKLKLEQDDADARKAYFEGKIKNQANQIAALGEELAAKQEDAAAAREANIAAIKSANPDFANSFVMNSAKGGEYMDPTQKARLEQGLGYVKLGDVKDKQPNLQHIQLKDGEIGVFNPQTGDVRGTGVKGDYVNPYSLASYKASLSLDTEEKRPMAKDIGEKKATAVDYASKGYLIADGQLAKQYGVLMPGGVYAIHPNLKQKYLQEVEQRKIK